MKNLQITQESKCDPDMEKSGAEYYICRTCHCRAGLEEEPKRYVLRFSTFITSVGREGILSRKAGQRSSPEKGSVWLVPARHDKRIFLWESSMERLFHLNVLCSDGTDLLYGVRAAV